MKKIIFSFLAVIGVSCVTIFAEQIALEHFGLLGIAVVLILDFIISVLAGFFIWR